MELIKMKYLITPTLIIGAIGTIYFIKKKIQKYRAINKFNYLIVKVVCDQKDCYEVIQELRRRCKSHHTIGFDCEWVTLNGKRRPVSLVQLSTFDGFCGLFRLDKLNCVPDSLKELLEDKSIYKVGVAPSDDAKYLHRDFSVSLRSTLDIRHIVLLSGHQAGGLAALSLSLLGVKLDKSWRVRCSDWEAEELSQKQIKYAALDAHVAVRIFVDLCNSLSTRSLLSFWRRNGSSDVWRDLDNLCDQFVDRKFGNTKSNVADESKIKKNGKKSEPKKNTIPIRTKPLYHNCYLEAPDGEILCTCDVKKAMWYIEKELADMVKESPLTVRLRFEPAARSVGEAGQFYCLVKENRCTVCGVDNSYIKKNVVPREYRRYFPEVMKDHSCHDVLLLCMSCHQRSNMSDLRIRQALAQKCGAPLPSSGFNTHNEDKVAKKVKSTAGTLLTKADNIPEERRKVLEQIVLEYYKEHTEITQELLREASELQCLTENLDYEAHGHAVVEHYRGRGGGGLLELEEVWRRHFLDTMQPRYLPRLWSVRHNRDRLWMRLLDGRLKEEHLMSLGLTDWIDDLKKRDADCAKNV